MAAPTFIQEAETTWTSAASASTKTTASFTTLAGDILVGVAGSEDNGRAPGSIGGGGLTWTEKNRVAVATYCQALIASATATAQSMTANIPGFNGNANFYGLNVLTFRASDGVGATAKTNVLSGAPSLSITTTQDNSAIVVVVLDWSAQDGTSRTWRTVNSITPTAGNGMERTYFRDAAAYTAYAAYYSDAGTAGAKTVGISAPGSQKYSIVALEVKGSGSVDATVTAVAALGLGDSPIPAVSAGAAISSPASLALGSAPIPTGSGVTVTTAPAALALGDAPAPAISANSLVTSPAALSTGAARVPAVNAAAVVVAPVALALGAAPVPSLQASSVIASPAALALGLAPVPTVSGTGSAFVVALPALALGSSPAPTAVVAALVVAPAALALGMVPVPVVDAFTPPIIYALVTPWFTPGSVVDVVPLTNANERAWAHERVEQRISQPYKLVIPIRPRQTPVLSAIAGDDGVARFLTVPPGRYWIIGEVDGIVRRVARTI